MNNRKTVEFKVTEEMKSEDFNFAVFVYENIKDCVCVNEISLEFLNETRNLVSNINEAHYFKMSYYTKEDITSIRKY